MKPKTTPSRPAIPTPTLGAAQAVPPTTRRRFLQKIALAVPALGFPTGCLQLRPWRAIDVDPAEMNKLSRSLKGRLILPADQAYEQRRRVEFWNLETERRPAAIVQCAHIDDVIRSVIFARRQRLELAVRAGGHSFQGWGTSNGLVLDLSGMKGLRIDPVRIAGWVEGGVLSGEFITAAARFGLAPVLGECATVGVTGVTLGGGLGWFAGTYGAACDSLLSATLVTAEGRVLHASATTNPSLFWAVRGGGGNLGIVTSLEYRLHPVQEVSTAQFEFPFRDALKIMRTFREFMAAAPDQFQPNLELVPGSQIVKVSGFHFGGALAGEQLFRSMRSWAAPSQEIIRRQTLAELGGLPLYSHAEPASKDGYSCCKGAYLETLSDEAIEVLLDCLAAAPKGATLGLSHYMHGAVCRVPPDATAFGLRKAGAQSVWIEVAWQDRAASDPSLSWASETSRRLWPYSGERIYSNFQSLEGKGSAEAVYGGNYARLAAIKAKVDPANFFRRNSNIPPSLHLSSHSREALGSLSMD